MILVNQAQWRCEFLFLWLSHNQLIPCSSWSMGSSQISERWFCTLWGSGKFRWIFFLNILTLINQLGCLSSVLRQLRVFHTDLNRFVTNLRERLGPQLQNVSLLYQGTPELKEVLADYGIHLNTPEVSLNTRELRARFQSLAENVFSVIAETRLFALFLDDLHEADPSLSGLGLIQMIWCTYLIDLKELWILYQHY